MWDARKEVPGGFHETGFTLVHLEEDPDITDWRTNPHHGGYCEDKVGNNTDRTQFCQSTWFSDLIIFNHYVRRPNLRFKDQNRDKLENFPSV